MVRHLLAFVVVFSACCTFAVDRVEAASISVSIDGASVDVPVRQGTKPNGQPIFFVGTEEQPFVYQTDNGKIEMSGELDPDPSISFGNAVTDFGTPSIFGFTYILPLAPIVSNPTEVFDSFSGSVTNGTGAGVTVTALAPLAGASIPVDGDGITEMEVFTLSDDGGVTWKNVGLDLGPTTVIPLSPGGSGLYGAFNEGFIPTIAGGPWTHMRADISFSLSGGEDIFSFNGAKVLIPEPASLTLLLFAIMVMRACGRFSR